MSPSSLNLGQNLLPLDTTTPRLVRFVAAMAFLIAAMGIVPAKGQEFLHTDTLTRVQEDDFDGLLDAIEESKTEPPQASVDNSTDDLLDAIDEANDKAASELELNEPQNRPATDQATEDADKVAEDKRADDKASQDDDAADEETDEDAEEDEDGKIGDAPEDNSELFLRSATVLLAPGEMQFDHGFTYTVNTVTTPIFREDGTLSTERLRSRQLIVPLGIRFGIAEKLQGSIDIPFGWSHIERADSDSDDFSDTFGLGDISVGISKLLKQEKEAGYDLIGTLSVSAPTGDDPFGISANDPALGLGFWTLSANFTAVKSYDPVVFFGSIGYSHTFRADHFGSEIQLGESFSYGFGMGMGVTDEVTLSASLSGLYQTETRINDIRAPRTSIEPISLRFGVTGLLSKCHIAEPFVRFGMTDDASDTNFGIVVTRL